MLSTTIPENKMLIGNSPDENGEIGHVKSDQDTIVTESPKIKLKKQWIFEVLCKYLKNIPHVRLYGPVVFGNLLQDDPNRKEVFSSFDVLSTYKHGLKENLDQVKMDLSPLFDQITVNVKQRDAIVKCTADNKQIRFRLHWTMKPLEYVGIDVYLVNVSKEGVQFGQCGQRGEYSVVSNLFRNIHNRRFEILAAHIPPVEPRTKYNSSEYEEKLMRFMITMNQVASTLDLGWTCTNDITKMLVPCLIHQLPPLGLQDELFQCSICLTQFPPGKRVFRHACCKKMVCFSCIMNFLKTKINGYSIECMYCLEDPFGWRTQRLYDSTDMDDSSDDSSD